MGWFRNCRYLCVLVCAVSEQYNKSNVFSGEEKKMAFVSREPIIRGTLPWTIVRRFDQILCALNSDDIYMYHVSPKIEILENHGHMTLYN